MGEILLSLAARSKRGHILNMNLSEHAAILKQLAVVSGLDRLKVVHHALRHGGASAMVAHMKRFDSLVIQTRRRRWAYSRVMRYKKAGHYVRQLGRSSADENRAADAASKRVAA